MLITQLTEAELDTFTLIERTVSVFSLLGCVFIIGTFAASNSFHKPINRLVFYASMYVSIPQSLASLLWGRSNIISNVGLLRRGNMMTNVATLMARSYVAYGESAACQFQAFLIQM